MRRRTKSGASLAFLRKDEAYGPRALGALGVAGGAVQGEVGEARVAHHDRDALLARRAVADERERAAVFPLRARRVGEAHPAAGGVFGRDGDVREIAARRAEGDRVSGADGGAAVPDRRGAAAADEELDGGGSLDADVGA